MWVLVAAQNLVTLFLGLELLSIPLYVLCATEMRRATSLEAGLKYLIIGSVGSATLLYGLAFIYGATGSTDFSGIARAAGDVTSDPLLLTGIALSVVGLAFKASVAPFHQWTPDVYEGAPDAGHRLHGRGHQGGGVRRLPAPLRRRAARRQRRLGARARRARHHHHRRGQRRRAGPELAQAPDGVVLGRAGRLHAGRRRGRHAPRRAGDRLLPRRLPDDEPGRLRGHRHPRARDGPGRRHRLRPGARRPAPAAGGGDDPGHARPGGHPGHRRLHRQVLFDRRGHRRRLRVARRRHRHRLDDLARLLPEGHRRDVDGRGAGGRDRAADAPDGPRWPAARPRPTRPASRSRRGSWRSSSARRRSSSGSCPRRCSTWPSTPGARSPTCSRETESLSRPGPTSGGVRGGFAVCAACGTSSARA